MGIISLTGGLVVPIEVLDGWKSTFEMKGVVW